MAEIQISGYSVLVDDEDIERISVYHWFIGKREYLQKGLAYFRNKRRINGLPQVMLLHRFIMHCTVGDGKTVDHINGNTFDCRKANLRICTIQENNVNRKLKRTNTSGYRGVVYDKKRNTWVVSVGGISRIYMGTFIDKSEAARAYDIGSLYMYGSFARTNFPRENYDEVDLPSMFIEIRKKHCMKLGESI